MNNWTFYSCALSLFVCQYTI